MISTSGHQTVLSLGDHELVVVEVGGGIRSYSVAGRPVIDGYGRAEMCPSGRGQILAPWPNRLEDGLFEWGGMVLQTPLTEPEHRNAIHGLVRWSSWRLAKSGTAEARLEHRLYPQPGWPWTLDLAVTYRLADRGLTVTTSVTRIGGPGESCPVGLGWHPYLDAFGGLVDDSVLTLPAEIAYRSDDRGLPAGTYDVEGTDVDFRAGRRIGGARLDTAFTGLSRAPDGTSSVTLRPAVGSEAVRLWVGPSFSHLMVYSGDTLGDESRRRRGLAVEPMTCAPNMLKTGDGLRVLEDGATLQAEWGLETFSFS